MGRQWRGWVLALSVWAGLSLPGFAQGEPREKTEARKFMESFLAVTVEQNWQKFADMISPSKLAADAKEQDVPVERYKAQMIQFMMNKSKTREAFCGYELLSEDAISADETRFVFNQKYQPVGEGAEPRWEEENLWAVREDGRWVVTFSGSDPVPAGALEVMEKFLKAYQASAFDDAVALIYPDYLAKFAEDNAETDEEFRKKLAASLGGESENFTMESHEISRRNHPMPTVAVFEAGRTLRKKDGGAVTKLQETFVVLQNLRDGKWYVTLENYPLDVLQFRTDDLKEENGRYTVRATAVNVTEKTVRLADVSCMLTDAKGAVLAHAPVVVVKNAEGALAPAGKAEFTVVVDYKGAAKFKSVEYILNAVRYKD